MTEYPITVGLYCFAAGYFFAMFIGWVDLRLEERRAKRRCGSEVSE